ncbi:hypothetical protein ACH5RR_004723 [Cinchona calisaya]|uniref:Uncharacterized protein n=1 Tax=Cinchona calisaya TaxID=153742 RepID=A0ABD3AZB2_9GENT
MKVISILLLGLMVFCSCLAAPRRAIIMGEMQQKKRPSAENINGVAFVSKMRMEKGGIEYLDGNIKNHHNIPRQYYNQRGSSSSSNSNNADDNSNNNNNNNSDNNNDNGGG